MGLQAYSSIRQMIIDARLKPRERLSDQELAGKLGISRTPVREALNKLAAEGLVVMDRRGTTVSDIDMAYMVNIYETRAALEGFAAYMAAAAISDEDIREMRACLQVQCRCIEGTEDLFVWAGTCFHRVLLTRSANKVLIDIVSKLMDECERFRASTHYAAVMKEFTVDGHEQIIQAAQARNAAALEQIVRDHLMGVAQRIAKQNQRLRNGGEKV